MTKEEFFQCLKQEGDCLIWPHNPRSVYGYVIWDGKHQLAHRVAFLLHHGKYPDGILHHECRNTKCQNINHLTDMSRSDHSFTHNKNTKTHCMRGHEYTVTNTYQNQGRRICRKCLAKRMREYGIRRKARL